MLRNGLAENNYYHGRIEVKNNRFRAAERPLALMMSVDEAKVTGNVFEADSTYPFFPSEVAGYHFTTADSPKRCFCIAAESLTTAV